MVPYARLDHFSQVLSIHKNRNSGALHLCPCCGSGSNLSNLCVGVCRVPHRRKLRTWKRGNGSMLTASWLQSHMVVDNTCTVVLTRLQPFKSSAKATMLVLTIRNVYVRHEQVCDRNYVILLHNYGDLCYRLHIYLLTRLLFIHRALSFSFYTQLTPTHLSTHR